MFTSSMIRKATVLATFIALFLGFSTAANATPQSDALAALQQARLTAQAAQAAYGTYVPASTFPSVYASINAAEVQVNLYFRGALGQIGDDGHSGLGQIGD